MDDDAASRSGIVTRSEIHRDWENRFSERTWLTLLDFQVFTEYVCLKNRPF